MKIGVDIGGSHVGIGVVNEKGEMVENLEKDYTEEEKSYLKKSSAIQNTYLDGKNDNKTLMSIAEDYIVDTVNFFKDKYEIEKVGLAIPGTISDGVILKSVNLGITNYDIKKRLEERLHLEVSVRNDAKCAAIAEFRFGKYSNMKNILFLTLGTGIGGAFIYNGELLSGNLFDGYEFGHIVLKENGILCNCGKRGCFERYGSILTFKKKCIEYLGVSNEISGPDLRRAIKENWEGLNSIINQYISDLALGLSNLINIFEPDMTIIGGGFARYDYLLLDLLKKEIISKDLLFNSRDEINLEVATLGNDAGIIGSVC